MDSATSISYVMWKVLPFDNTFCLFWRFFIARVQFRLYYYFRFKMCVIFKNSAHPCSYEDAVISDA